MGRSIAVFAAPGDPAVEAYARRHGLDRELFNAVWAEERRLYTNTSDSEAALSLAHLAYIAEVKRAQQA